MVARDASDLAKRTQTLDTAALLTACLCQTFGIPVERIYSHQLVSKMDKRFVPEVADRIDFRPYGAQDPGEQNRKTIQDRVRERLKQLAAEDD